MQRTKSQLNAIYYSYRDRAERRRNARKALYGWLAPGDLSDSAAFWLEHVIDDGCAGEFVPTAGGFCEARSTINWDAVRASPCYTNLYVAFERYHASPRYTNLYVAFERYRADARAENSPYYRRRLAKIGLDWKLFNIRPYGTEAIELD